MLADRKFKVINFCQVENMNLLRDSISFEQVALDVNTRRWSCYGQPSFLLSTTLSRELIIVVSSYFLCTFQRRSVIARQRASFCVSALGLSKANLALKVVYRRHYWRCLSYSQPGSLTDLMLSTKSSTLYLLKPLLSTAVLLRKLLTLLLVLNWTKNFRVLMHLRLFRKFVEH